MHPKLARLFANVFYMFSDDCECPLIKFELFLIVAYNYLMSIFTNLLVILLIASLSNAQDSATQALIAENPALLITLNNYFGCAKWDSQTCLECSKNFFFNAKGICCQVSPQCKVFNQAQGICEDCYQGYALYNGTCKVPQNNPNPGCLSWDGNNNCLQCSVRFYFNSQKVCTPISNDCYTWDNSGACTSCYGGYILDGNGKCIVNPTPFTPSKDSLCKTWEKDVCTSCSSRAYFDSNGICQAVSNYCNTWDGKTGNCLSCFGGYDLSKGSCVFSPSNNAKPSDLGCSKWDWNNNLCLSCSPYWVFNANKICVPVSDFCKSSNQNGACTSCYNGYDLNNGACLLSPSNNIRPSDLGCSSWDWNKNTCLNCSKNWFFNSNKICTQVSDLCKSHASSGQCSSCYQGYDLVNGSCVISSKNKQPKDQGCGKWDWNNQACLSCSKNWVFNKNGFCIKVSDQCRQSDNTGQCTACYKGYQNSNGACIFSKDNNAVPTDSGCGKWDWDNQICLQCSQSWTFDYKGTCIPVSDQCKTWSSAGECLTCFKGYDLKKGQCIYSAFNNAKPSDSGCSQWDWDNQLCLKCSKGWQFNANKACVPVSDQCKTWSSAGLCTSCFKGYDLKDGSCVFSAFNNAKPSDSGCSQWDWDNQLCLKCSKGWQFNANKACVPVSDQCKTWSSAGLCTSCFKGYDLKDGSCVFSAFNNAKPSDSGCSQWDWDNQLCLKCSKGWQFNANKACAPVSDQCKTWSSAGLCTSCFKGYDLKDGSCVFSAFNNAKPSDSGCSQWDWDNQLCLKCSKGWQFNANKACAPVSDQCKTWSSAGLCTSCFKGYDLKDGSCVFSAFNNAKPSDSGCSQWDWDNQLCLKCSKGWQFNANKACVPVSDQCKTWSSAGLCTSCFKGYDLKDGSCVFSAFNNAKPSDSGCSQWDWDNQLCLKCSKGWQFNANKACVPVSDQCKTWSSAGLCTSCFKGYDLKDGSCVFSAFNNAKPSDSGCSQWDWDNQLCLKCSKGWQFNANKACVPVSDQCKTWSSAGLCTSCFKGYDLKDGSCVFSAFNNAKPSDSGCSQWDWDNQLCLKCSTNWVFNSQGICIAVSDQCLTSSNNGICLTCYKGYDLFKGQCILSPSNTAKPSDPGCGKWDWNNQICLQCSQGWVFDANKNCIAVDNYCSTYDSTGSCTSCFKGYILSNKKCISGNPLCKASNQNGGCTSCYTGYVLVNNGCTPISKLADLYLYYSQCCPEKLASLQKTAKP